jgi:hypothetical protein
MGELRGYGEREQTRTDHLREAARFAGWRSMDTGEWKDLDEFLFARVMEHDSPKLLFRVPRPRGDQLIRSGAQSRSVATGASLASASIVVWLRENPIGTRPRSARCAPGRTWSGSAQRGGPQSVVSGLLVPGFHRLLGQPSQ